MKDNALFRLVGQLIGDRRGVLAVEFALMLPILVLLTMSGVEIYRFILLNQKIERTSVTIADLTSQAKALTEDDLNNLLMVSSQVMNPFDLTVGGQIIVSSIGAKGGNPAQIDWQRTFGAATNTSALGNQGGTPALPAGFVVRDNENVIVAEVFYQYTPLIVSGVVDPVVLYNATFFRTRFESLDTLN